MFKPSPASLGFSLIELLITVAIMSLVVGGAIAGFVAFQAKEEVRTAAKNIQQLVKTTQGKARVQETPTANLTTNCNSDGNRLQGYRITISSTVATIYAFCGVDMATITSYTQVYSESISGVTYSGPDVTDFFTLYRGVTSPSGLPATYQFTKGSSTYSFTVGVGGAISEVE